MPKNKLVVKEVDFFGDMLKAARDEQGIVWAGVKWLCDGIGLSEGQRQRQTTNIQSDIVLSKGVANLKLPTKGGNQEVLCLQLDYVPLWLAKISITPTMRESSPELVEKLVNYQLKAKDVLAAAFLPLPKAVNELTMNSRDIARILGKTHATIMNLMRERVEELERMGFNRLEFYQDSTYKGGNNLPDPFPEYICTERGCEDFSNKLNPETRERYLKEIADRFERMQDARDGKPVKRVGRPIEDQAGPEEAVIRLYRNNQWGILSMNGILYNLTANEFQIVQELLPRLIKREVKQIPEVINAFLDSSGRPNKLELLGEYLYSREDQPGESTPTQEAAAGSKRVKTDPAVNMDDMVNLDEKLAKSRYGVGAAYLHEIAEKIGATVRIGKRRLYDRQKMDDYFKGIAK